MNVQSLKMFELVSGRKGSAPSITVLVSLLFAAALTVPPVAQSNRNDPQVSYESGSPGAGQIFLGRFVGNWEVAKTFHRRSGEPVTTMLECRQSMINEGRFLKSEFFLAGHTNTMGLGFIGFEPRSGLFTSVWMDSRSTKMSIRQSKQPFDGSEIILFSVATGDGQPEERPSRDVTRLVDDGRKIIHRQYSVNPDQTEQLRLELTMTKKNP